jgi:hypothetical protein
MPAFSQQFSQATPLITQPIDESYLTTLKGNTHPLAQAQYDIGVAAPNLPLQRMLLVLKRSSQQDHALRTLLDDQQDKASPNYHKWVTPELRDVGSGRSTRHRMAAIARLPSEPRRARTKRDRVLGR